jgi:SHS2 domain-containing protein
MSKETNIPKRKGPSAEIQSQIDEAIAARSRTTTAYDGRPHNIESSHSTEHDHNNNQHDEPGVPPPGACYEYLNHPADILLHSWGTDFVSSLQNLALAMFGCITSLSCISIDSIQSEEYGHTVARGHDVRSLVYAFLDEWLFNFHDTGFVPKEISMEYDASIYSAVSWGYGEVLDLSRHSRGMEVKAITYSAMRVVEKDGRWDVYVVVDI